MNTETNSVAADAVTAPAAPVINLDEHLTATTSVAATTEAPAATTAAPAAADAPAKPRRGRPPGKKNAPKVKAAKAPKVKAARRGRPPGSKNKPKTGKVVKAKAPKAAKVKKVKAAKVKKSASRKAGIKAQAQITKELNKRFLAEAKESGKALSVVIREYIYKGAKYSPAEE